jgi:hypothetical protein
MKSKVTSAKMAKLASKVLKGYEPTRDEIEGLAACVLTQREKEIVAKKEVAPVAETAPVEAPVAEAPVADAPVAEAAPEARKDGFWGRIFPGR